MNEINQDYIQEYIRSLIKTDNLELEKFKKNCIEEHRPIIQDEVGQFIKVMLNIINPSSILEIGTNVGYSSIFMCLSLEKRVNITTIEINEDVVEEARRNIAEFGCKANINVICGDAAEVIETIKGNFDIAFIDAAKSHYGLFLEKMLPMMNTGGIIICDNVLFNGYIANDDLVKRRKRTIVKNLRNFLKSISEDNRFETSIIPIGDGIALIKIKNQL